jgi:hypothetical protein
MSRQQPKDLQRDPEWKDSQCRYSRASEEWCDRETDRCRCIVRRERHEPADATDRNQYGGRYEFTSKEPISH